MPYKDPEQARISKKAWRKNNLAKQLASEKKWREENASRWKEIKDKACRLWNSRNPDRRKQIVKTWRSLHPENNREYCRRRRARKRAAIIKPISMSFYVLALEAWNHRCAYCQCDLYADGIQIEWDHFMPLSRGGAHAEYNIVPVCSTCNLKKKAKDPFIFLAGIK